MFPLVLIKFSQLTQFLLFEGSFKFDSLKIFEVSIKLNCH